MQTDSVSLYEIFAADNELRCPLFQRRYVWRKENIRTLWEDIDTLLDGQFDKRFLGALVFHNEIAASASKPGLYWIIDGQQRLSTFYLLLLSLIELSSEVRLAQVRDQLIEQYLLSRKKSSEGQPKLRPTLEDTRQFNSIIQSVIGGKANLNFAHEFGPSDGMLRDGYQFMLKETRKRCKNEDGELCADKVDHVFETVLERIEFVEILLGKEHDPNEVFDRLNKEGERLGIIDLVRNEVLKRLKDLADKAEDVYASEWRPFEDSFRYEKNRDQYFFPFALANDPSITKSRTFRALSDRWESLVGDEDDPAKQVGKIMVDLGRHAPAFQAIREGRELEDISDEMRVVLDRLFRLDLPIVTFPYFLNLITNVREGKVSVNAAIKCCDVIESFLVRRAFVGLEPTGLHAVFKGLWQDVESNHKLLVDQLQTATIQFPDDEQFAEAIRYAPLYKKNKSRFIIQEYEIGIKRSNVFRSVPDFTLDHILPQDPAGQWLERFTEEEREKYTHVWANLVPLSPEENSAKGQSSWEETREKLQHDAMFSTTSHLLAEFGDWNVDSIKRRSEKLVKWALQRWPKVFDL